MEENDIKQIFERFRTQLKCNNFAFNLFCVLCNEILYDKSNDKIICINNNKDYNENRVKLASFFINFRSDNFLIYDHNSFDYIFKQQKHLLFSHLEQRHQEPGDKHHSSHVIEECKKSNYIFFEKTDESMGYIKSILRNNKINKIINEPI